MTPACPACGRKLLSLASARCNWCGKTIPDAEFQAHADAARAAYFAHIAAHDTASLLAMEDGPGFAPAVLPPPPVPADPATGEEPVISEEDAAHARFQHLEL